MNIEEPDGRSGEGAGIWLRTRRSGVRVPPGAPFNGGLFSMASAPIRQSLSKLKLRTPLRGPIAPGPLILEQESIRSLLVPQGNHWVYFSGTARGNETSQERSPDQQQGHSAESQRIGRSDAKEQRLHGARQGQRAGNPNRN